MLFNTKVWKKTAQLKKAAQVQLQLKKGDPVSK